MRQHEGARAVMVAPDSFKGTFTAAEVAVLMSAGARQAGWRPKSCPLADGGEGTLDVFASSADMKVYRATVQDPFGGRVDARFLLDDGGRAFVEAAEAVGLGRVREPDPESALIASSAGVGELINHAIALGAKHILVGVGGSATSDGGAGLLGVLEAGDGLGEIRVEVLTDSTTSYEEAARVFSRQKGADPAGVEELTRRLYDLGGKLPRDPRGVSATGCGGGMSGALWACGAELAIGADAVMRLLHVEELIEDVDLVITGEGSLDGQTLTGKLVARLGRLARQRQRPFAVIAGRISLDDDERAALGAIGLREAGSPGAIQRAARELCEEQPNDPAAVRVSSW